MATDIVGSLFGVTPEALQMQRDLLQQKQAQEYAGMTPVEQSQYAMYRGGQQAGNVVAGLMGAEDPQLKAVRTASELAKQYDITSLEGLKQYAGALQQAGLPQFASMALDRYNSLATAGIEQTKKVAETKKTLGEVDILGREIKEIGVPGNSELVQKAVVDKAGNVISLVGAPYSRFSMKQTINTGDKNVLAVDQKRSEEHTSELQSH